MKHSLTYLLSELALYAKQNGLLREEDEAYAMNAWLSLMRGTELTEEGCPVHGAGAAYVDPDEMGGMDIDGDGVIDESELGWFEEWFGGGSDDDDGWFENGFIDNGGGIGW